MNIKGFQEIEDQNGKRLSLITDKGVLSLDSKDWRFKKILNKDYSPFDKDQIILSNIKCMTSCTMYKIITTYGAITRAGVVPVPPAFGNALFDILTTTKINLKIDNKILKKIQDTGNIESFVSWLFISNGDIFYEYDREMHSIDFSFLKTIYSKDATGYNYYVNVPSVKDAEALIYAVKKFYLSMENRKIDFSRNDMKLGFWAKMINTIKDEIISDSILEKCEFNIKEHLDKIDSKESLVRTFLEC